MRRTRIDSSHPQPSVSVADITAPSVPPQIREILRLPETPAPPPRRRPRVLPRHDAQGRRLPAGPPPPRSWLSSSRHAPRLQAGGSLDEGYERRLIPGLYRPAPGSLIDITLQKLALDWDYQRVYNTYYLYALPDRLRMALISYVTTIYEPGLSMSDLKLLFSPQVSEDDREVDEPKPSPRSLNEGVTHLDLSTSVGRAIKLRELSTLLFPSDSDSKDLVLESWDSAEAPPIPLPLLPNLTHLSLAASPETSPLSSWRQLLSLSAHLPTLTHLSLAFWPVPTLTPNSTLTKVVTAQGQSIPVGGTNFYSHSLDNDYSEAILILRKLSENMYGLEYLDLTGCSSWQKALTASADGDQIDWVGTWGKVTDLILNTGYVPPPRDQPNMVLKFNDAISTARQVERTIRARRAGRGRFITVERDEAASSSWYD